MCRFLYRLAFLLLLTQANLLRAEEAAAPFDRAKTRAWLEEFRKEAITTGVSGDFFDRAFAAFAPLPQVIAAANYQPELVKSPGDYVNLLASAVRIRKGRELLAQHIGLLEALERRYGVDRYILLAIWGIESNYGKNTGKYNVIRALATLAIEGRRAQFARKQLLALLPILEREKLPIDVTGSWAGAMGQVQFIPTSYVDYAVDYDRDGQRDIWDNVPDSLGSAANYLKRFGWVTGLFWGVEVHLPKGFDMSEYDKDALRPLKEWRQAGYVLAGGEDARAAIWDEHEARLLLMENTDGPAFLVTKNFNVLLKYNGANIYATAVGHLSDRLRGGETFVTAWHEDNKGNKKQNKKQDEKQITAQPQKPPQKSFPDLTRDEIKTAQKLLTALGFDTGAADGLFGKKTQTALQSWQEQVNLEANGILSLPVLYQISAAALALSSDEIKLLQQRLAALGFDPGVADGLIGRKTRSALRSWQEKTGLPVNGHPDRDILVALGTASIQQDENESEIDNIDNKADNKTDNK